MARSLGVIAAVLASIMVLAAPPAQAINLVVNGDFEIAVPSNGTGGGWTSSTIDGAGGHRTTGGNPNGTFFLNDSGQAPTDPSIQQTIGGLIPGATYRVQGDWAAANIGGGSQHDFAVLVDGSIIFSAPVPSSTTTFSHFDVNYIATLVSHTLLLKGEDINDADPRIDNISFECVQGCEINGRVNTPEPSTLLLLGSALGLIALRSRRSRQ